ncbi:MAG: hypothetical protein R3Y68_04185 [Rikenellaceae bacterium]
MNMTCRQVVLLTLVLLLVALSALTIRSCRNTSSLRRERVSYIVDSLHYDDVEPIAVSPSDSGRDTLYTFRDTLQGRWSAEIEGSNVALRSMVLLDAQEIRHDFARPEWEVALKSGVAQGSLWVGLGVSRSVGSLTLSLDGGYDAWRGSPYVGASASFSIWRE